MKHFVDSVQVPSGSVVPSASVSVFVAGSNTLASLFSDDGITGTANPTLTDALGQISFYVADGRYDLRISKIGTITKTISDIEIADITQANAGDSFAVFGAISTTANASGGVGNDASGGALNIHKAASPAAIFMGRAVDQFGNNNSQLIGWNVEQMMNPSTGPVNYSNFAHTSELFTPSSNVQDFTAAQAVVDFSFVHFGSGNFTGSGTGYGVIAEAFNSGPATMALLVGSSGVATNGPVSAGIPVQTPTGNGNVTNARGVVGHVLNSSSGVITTAAAIHVDSNLNTGGGSITTSVGLNVNNQTAGVSNFAIKTGLGVVSFGDAVSTSSTFTATGGAGTGAAAFGTTGLLAADVVFVGGSSSTTGVSQGGIQIAPSLSGTTQSTGLIVRADVPVSTTIATNGGIVIQTPTIGGGGAITNYRGLIFSKAPVVSTSAHAIEFDGSTSGSTFLDGPAVGGSNVVTLPAATGTVQVSGNPISGTTYNTATNCSSSASPAVCGAAASGSVVVAAGATTVTVNTTAVTANSQIFIQPDDSLGTKLSVTCNTTGTLLDAQAWVSARTAATSFVVTLNAAPSVNPECFSYFIVN